MARHVSTGTCNFCQATVSKATMTRHLGACKPRQAVSALPSDPGQSRRATLLHLVVEGRIGIPIRRHGSIQSLGRQ